MMNIDRYEMELMEYPYDDRCHIKPDHHPHGDWVKYEDYQAVVAEMQELIKHLEVVIADAIRCLGD